MMNRLLDWLGDDGTLRSVWLVIKIQVYGRVSYRLEQVRLTWFARRLQAHIWKLALNNPAHSMGEYQRNVKREAFKAEAAKGDEK